MSLRSLIPDSGLISMSIAGLELPMEHLTPSWPWLRTVFYWKKLDKASEKTRLHHPRHVRQGDLRECRQRLTERGMLGDEREPMSHVFESQPLQTGTRRGTLIAGWAGVVHVALALFASVALTGEAGQPSWTDSPQAIVRYYRDASFDGTFITGMILVGVSFLLFLVFIAKIADLLGGVDGGSRWVGWLILGGAALEMAFGIFGYLASFLAAVFGAESGGLADTDLLVLHHLRFAFYGLDLLAMSIWMIPLGLAIVVSRRFPRWIGWALLVNALAMVPSLYLPTVYWDATSGISILLMLALAIVLLRTPHRYSEVPTE